MDIWAAALSTAVAALATVVAYLYRSIERRVEADELDRKDLIQRVDECERDRTDLSVRIARLESCSNLQCPVKASR